MPMLSHEAVWRGIDLLAARNRLSASGLAKRAGLDPTTFNKSKRSTIQGKARWPSTESLAKILDATRTSMSDFVRLLGEAPPEPAPAPAPPQRRLRSVPFSQADATGLFDAAGFPTGREPWEEIELPLLADEAAYGLEIDSDIAPPILRRGDIAVIAPGSAVRRDDRVLLRRRDGGLAFGVFLRRTAQRLAWQPLGEGGGDRQLDLADLAWQARVVAICAGQ